MFILKIKWALLWAVLIFILYAIPGRDIPHVSFLELLQFDKLIHAFLFFVLLLFCARSFFVQENFLFLRTNARLVSFLFCVVYGAALEIMQGAFFEDRTADVYDFTANSFGSAAGLLCFPYFERRILYRFIR